MFQKEDFGARLRQLRQSRGEKQADLGEVLHVSTAQISDMEHGKATTTLEKLFLICQHYGVSADYLLGLKDSKQ